VFLYVNQLYFTYSFFADAEANFKNKTVTRGEKLIGQISPLIVSDVQRLGNQGHKNLTESIKNEIKKIYVAKDEDGLERHPKHFLDIP